MSLLRASISRSVFRSTVMRTLEMDLGGGRLQPRILDQLRSVLGAPDEASGEGRAPILARREVQGGPAAERPPLAAGPAHGHLARRPRSQASLADVEQVARRVLRVDPLDLRVHPGLAGGRRHLDLELARPPEQRRLQPAHANALLVPAHIAPVARHGDAVERPARAFQASGHAQASLVEADRPPELTVPLEAEVAGQHMTVEDGEVHLAREPELRGERRKGDAAAIGEVRAVAGEGARLDDDVRALEGDLHLRAEGQGRRRSEAGGPGPEGEAPRQHAGPSLREAAPDVRQLQVEGHALVIQLQLSPRDEQAPDLDFTPGPAEGEARQVVAAPLERVDADAGALDHHAREHQAAIE